MTTAPINCSHSAVWPLADFKPHPRNVNTHPEEQLRLLAKVIVGKKWEPNEYGMKLVTVDNTNV